MLDDNVYNSVQNKKIRIDDKKETNISKKPDISKNQNYEDEFETEAETNFKVAEVDSETGEQINSQGTLSLAHKIRHQVALPLGYPYIPINEHKRLNPPMRTYPFTLDPFQEVSVASIERNESVLVSAHTSAGKTVVAEYAIATALKKNQRVIYTSPIKALSNQKYRELLETFGDVGLMTGDVTINPSASCLVMTTEILRSMMYRGSEVMREVAWVIFDEIHYMRDKFRGVVWEETIILLPHKVRYVFLSATIPNALQFAQWICKIHDQPCHVVYTDFRPVPLQHYVFPAGGDGIFLCVDEKATFKEENFSKAISGIQDIVPTQKDPKKNLSAKGDLFKIIKMIWVRNYQPVIVFSFSKRECEANAIQMSKLEFNTKEEQETVAAVYKNAIASLSDDDQTLPQIQNILPLLQRGIGIHHSGLLQILKEVIEILFQEGLIKVLFATETFSIGLNMPAKTVVFTSVRKWDGQDFRWVTSGEYIQMSGRAGRRGLDDRGIVILMIDQAMEPEAARTMLKGQADCLNSAYHLKYHMILNLMRVEGVLPEYMLENSFFQFQNNDSIPALEEKITELEKQREEMKFEEEPVLSEYYDIYENLQSYKKNMRDIIVHPDYCTQYLQPGRLVKINHENLDYGWGVVVNYTKKKDSGISDSKISSSQYVLDILLHCEPGFRTNNPIPPPSLQKKGEMVLCCVPFSSMEALSCVRIHLPKDLKSLDSRNQTLRSVLETQRRFPDGLPLLDPVEDMGIKESAFIELVRKVEILEKGLQENPISKRPKEEVEQLYKQFAEKMKLNDLIKEIKQNIKKSTLIMQLDELKHRKRVLRRLGYVSENGVIELKGRVACEISTGDELILTEMIFSGVFTDLAVEQAVSLLSCFSTEEKSNEAPAIEEEMKTPIKILKETARRIAQVSNESKVVVDEETYVEGFRTELVGVVLAWCRGSKFSEICKMTDMFEGSIIRSIRRLEELMRQLIAAAKQIGNLELEKKFEEGIKLIKRDIVFAASLYL
jgi:ATP-dependent RNA helicase DOB1